MYRTKDNTSNVKAREKTVVDLVLPCTMCVVSGPRCGGIV